MTLYIIRGDTVAVTAALPATLTVCHDFGDRVPDDCLGCFSQLRAPVSFPAAAQPLQQQALRKCWAEPADFEFLHFTLTERRDGYGAAGRGVQGFCGQSGRVRQPACRYVFWPASFQGQRGVFMDPVVASAIEQRPLKSLIP
jgi:hypothetical protein